MARLHSILSLQSLVGKTVLLRIDTDVDIDKGQVEDETRLSASLPTIKYLLDKGADINIVGHLGRPGGENIKYSLEPVAKWFEKKLKGSIKKTEVGEFKGWEITERVNLLENIRFYEGEEKNDEKFSRELSLLGDIFVNDAFAVAHRKHASTVGVTKFLSSYPGIHFEREIEVLGKILKNPKRPLAVLIGGAKIETKLPLVHAMHRIADYVLVGGEIAEQDRILIRVQHEKAAGKKSMVFVSDLMDDGSDITPKSVENFKQILKSAATIVWNGPVGIIRKSKAGSNNQAHDTEKGTRELAHFIASAKAYRVVGGGDTLMYLQRLNLLDKFDFVSTGGGAMLEFLSGKTLPGIAALGER